MEEERLFNENVFGLNNRQRTISSPVPHESYSRPLSPGGPIRCYACGQLLSRRTSERFVKPAIPIPMMGLNTSAPNVLHSTNVLTGGNGICAGGCGSGGSGAQSSMNTSFSSSSQNSSLPGSTSTSSHNISFSINNANSNNNNNSGQQQQQQTSYIAPASPMDTNISKE
jgi:coiled-coil domain-containing protein 6